MADVVCSYQLENDASSTGYLIFTNNLSLAEIKNHFCDIFTLDQCELLSEHRQQISSTEQLHSLISNATVTIIIRNASLPIPRIPPEIQIQEEVPEVRRKVLGPAVQGALKYFNVELNPEYQSVGELVQSMPFGKCVQKRICMASKHPRWFERKVQKIATRANVDALQLQQELLALIAEMDAEPKPEIEIKCSHCEKPIEQVRYQCLSCWKFGLCSACESLNPSEAFHDRSHVFAKLNPEQLLNRRSMKFGHFRCPSRFMNSDSRPSERESNEQILGPVPVLGRFAHAPHRGPHPHPHPHHFHPGTLPSSLQGHPQTEKFSGALPHPHPHPHPHHFHPGTLPRVPVHAHVNFAGEQRQPHPAREFVISPRIGIASQVPVSDELRGVSLDEIFNRVPNPNTINPSPRYPGFSRVPGGPLVHPHSEFPGKIPVIHVPRVPNVPANPLPKPQFDHISKLNAKLEELEKTLADLKASVRQC